MNLIPQFGKYFLFKFYIFNLGLTLTILD